MGPRSLITFLLALASPVIAQGASGSGRTTRYWDCCKPSCAWPNKAPVSQPILTCSKNDSPLRDPSASSGCDGGSAFACGNNSPFAVNDNVAYGFAATAISGKQESNWCCACYALTFTSGPVAGKTMVVQTTNTGGDLGSNHFDIQMPGGGVGLFDGCTPQFGGIPGERYGGVSSRSQCDQMPSFLKQGCYWRFDWFKNADNPNMTFKQVRCPSALTSISGCVRSDDSQFPVFDGSSGQQPTSTRTSAGTGPSSPAGSVPLYGQCGGEGWTGSTTCVSGAKCQSQGQWYSQCVPA